MKNCGPSPSGEHAYDLRNYARDDQGFYLDCVHCNKTAFFDCNSEEELYGIFGLDDEDGYDERDYEDEED